MMAFALALKVPADVSMVKLALLSPGVVVESVTGITRSFIVATGSIFVVALNSWLSEVTLMSLRSFLPLLVMTMLSVAVALPSLPMTENPMSASESLRMAAWS